MTMLWFHRIPRTELADALCAHHRPIRMAVHATLFGRRRADRVTNDIIGETALAAGCGIGGGRDAQRAEGPLFSPRLVAE